MFSPKNLKNRIITVFIVLFTLFQLVRSDVANSKCSYYCNLKGKYQNTVVKNVDNLTLGQYAKKKGNYAQYYMLCCDGAIRSRTGVDIIRNDLTVLKNMNVIYPNSKTYEYMDTSKECSTYCAITNNRGVYKNSEGLSLGSFSKKYRNVYNYFAYCCNGKFDSDRMVITDTQEEFNIDHTYVVSMKNYPLSTSWRCGKEYNTRCPDGYCCSKYNYCGKTTDHCKVGCQSDFGVCN